MNFDDVEREVAGLRQDLSAGRLNEEQFKTRLRELMVEDANGDWWMVGYETGEWYRHDGNDWVRADPPGRAARQTPPKPVIRPVDNIGPKPRPFRGVVVFLLGLVISGALGWGMAALTYNTLSNSLDVSYDSANAIGFAVWGAVGLGGLVLTFRAARKAWRKE